MVVALKTEFIFRRSENTTKRDAVEEDIQTARIKYQDLITGKQVRNIDISVKRAREGGHLPVESESDLRKAVRWLDMVKHTMRIGLTRLVYRRKPG